MPNKEMIIILNRIRDIVDSDSENSKLTLNKKETEELLKFLRNLKREHEKDINLIQTISTEIYKYNGDY